MKATEKLLRDGNKYSNPNRFGRRISRVSPRSELPYFVRVAMLRTLPQLVCALRDLVPRLLRRGQDASNIAHDLALLSRTAGLDTFVAVFVHEFVTRGTA